MHFRKALLALSLGALISLPAIAGDKPTLEVSKDDVAASNKEKLDAAAKTIEGLDNAFRVAAKDRKKLTRYERVAVDDARKAVYDTDEGKTLAHSLHSAAELLRSAAAGKAVDEAKAKKYTTLAGALETMSRRLVPDAKVSADANARAKRAAAILKSWDDVMSKKRTDAFAKAWKMLAEGDPRQRVLAKGLDATMALMGDCKSSCSEGDAAKAATILANVSDRFQKVPTVRRKAVNLDPAPPST
ncbi:MAG: hypothetical protein AAF483_14705 [Planctomycetota bacterium]